MLLTSIDEKSSKYPDHLKDALQTLKCCPQERKMRPIQGKVGQNLSRRSQQNRNKKESVITRNYGNRKATVNQKVNHFGLLPTIQKLDAEAEKERELQRVISKLKLGSTRRHTTSSNGLFERRNLSLNQLRLKKLDAENEKERELQRVMNNLKQNSYMSTTLSSSYKDSCVNRGGMDLTSGLFEGHKLTLKQLREFWREMPSFLNIHAASLRRKYGVYDDNGNDIDDLSIEIVKKYNEPSRTGNLPRLDVKAHVTDRKLEAIEEEVV